MTPTLLFGAKCVGFSRRGHVLDALYEKGRARMPCPWFRLFASAPEGVTIWFLTRLVVVALAVLTTLHLYLVDGAK